MNPIGGSPSTSRRPARPARGGVVWTLLIALAAAGLAPAAGAQGFYEGRRVRELDLRTPPPASDPAPGTPGPANPSPATAGPRRDGEAAAGSPGVTDVASPPATVPPSTASRLGMTPARGAGYLAGLLGGGLIGAWPVASSLARGLGGRFALGLLGAGAGLMAANWFMNRMTGRPAFDLVGPLSGRATGYLAGAVGLGSLMGGPVASMALRWLGLAGRSALLTGAGRLGLAGLGVAGGLFLANWLMNRISQAGVDRQIREHDRLWEDQDRQIPLDWQPSEGYLEEAATTTRTAPPAAPVPDPGDPLAVDDELPRAP